MRLSLYYRTNVNRFESKTESLVIVSATSDLTNTIETIQRENSGGREDIGGNELVPRLQVFNTSREDYE